MKFCSAIALTLVLVAASSTGSLTIETKITRHPDGSMAKSEDYLGDKRHGWWREWDEKGRLHFEAYYVHGKREGRFRRWNQDGTLWLLYNYVQDELDGLATDIDSDGRLVARGIYERNKPITGTFKEVLYFPSQRYAVMSYKNGKFIRAKLPNGKLVSGAHADVQNPVPGEEWNVKNEQYIYFTKGRVSKVTDVEGRELPRNRWRADFR